MRRPSLFLIAPLAAFILTLASSASAAPPWIYRRMVLPRHDWSFDVGLGVGHGDDPSRFGPGLNFEGAVSVTERVELGFRGGVRFGDNARGLRADGYGRLVDTETCGTRFDTFSNPEFHVRGMLVAGRVGELGLEGRVYLPIEGGSRFGTMFGVPVNFHFGNWGRLETGLYVPIVFYDNVATAVSIPGRLWFQVSEPVWLGPIVAARFYNPGGAADFLFGFGLGWEIVRWLDFKTQIIFPHIDDTAGARDFGLGVGLQFRIE